MEFVPTLAMVSLVITIINFLKYARAGDGNGMATTVSVWIAGVGVMFLVAQTDFAEGLSIGDRFLADYNAWSLLFMGLTVGSMGAFANDLRVALDNTTSSQKPNLTSLSDTTAPHSVDGVVVGRQ